MKAVQPSSKFEARTVPVAKVPAAMMAKRQSAATTPSSDVIDSINLNVDDEQGFTMTFIETTEDGDDDDDDDAAADVEDELE